MTTSKLKLYGNKADVCIGETDIDNDENSYLFQIWWEVGPNLNKNANIPLKNLRIMITHTENIMGWEEQWQSTRELAWRMISR